MGVGSCTCYGHGRQLGSGRGVWLDRHRIAAANAELHCLSICTAGQHVSAAVWPARDAAARGGGDHGGDVITRLLAGRGEDGLHDRSGAVLPTLPDHRRSANLPSCCLLVTLFSAQKSCRALTKRWRPRLPPLSASRWSRDACRCTAYTACSCGDCCLCGACSMLFTSGRKEPAAG